MSKKIIIYNNCISEPGLWSILSKIGRIIKKDSNIIAATFNNGFITRQLKNTLRHQGITETFGTSSKEECTFSSVSIKTPPGQTICKPKISLNMERKTWIIKVSFLIVVEKTNGMRKIRKHFCLKLSYK